MSDRINPMAWENLFYYGQDETGTINADIMTGLLQPRNTLPFNRDFGTDISSLENRYGLSKEIAVRFSISNFISRRNLEVSSNLQAITSNQAIEITKTPGNADIVVNYYRPDRRQGEVRI